jgi:hypothetical protein
LGGALGWRRQDASRRKNGRLHASDRASRGLEALHIIRGKYHGENRDKARGVASAASPTEK